MISASNELKRRLIHEKSLLESIEEVLLHQREAVLDNDITSLNETVEFLRQLLEKFAAVEEGRRNAMLQLADAAQLPPEDLTLQQLIDTLPDNQQSELAELGEQVRTLLESVDRDNRFNSYLIEKSQFFVRRNLLWMKRMQSPVTTYTSDSRVKVQPTGKQLINEAV